MRSRLLLLNSTANFDFEAVLERLFRLLFCFTLDLEVIASACWLRSVVCSGFGVVSGRGFRCLDPEELLEVVEVRRLLVDVVLADARVVLVICGAVSVFRPLLHQQVIDLLSHTWYVLLADTKSREHAK